MKPSRDSWSGCASGGSRGLPGSRCSSGCQVTGGDHSTGRILASDNRGRSRAEKHDGQCRRGATRRSWSASAGCPPSSGRAAPRHPAAAPTATSSRKRRAAYRTAGLRATGGAIAVARSGGREHGPERAQDCFLRKRPRAGFRSSIGTAFRVQRSAVREVGSWPARKSRPSDAGAPTSLAADVGPRDHIRGSFRILQTKTSGTPAEIR